MEKTNLDFEVEYSVRSTISVLLRELNEAILCSYCSEYVERLLASLRSLNELLDYNK